MASGCGRLMSCSSFSRSSSTSVSSSSSISCYSGLDMIILIGLLPDKPPHLLSPISASLTFLITPVMALDFEAFSLLMVVAYSLYLISTWKKNQVFACFQMLVVDNAFCIIYYYAGIFFLTMLINTKICASQMAK